MKSTYVFVFFICAFFGSAQISVFNNALRLKLNDEKALNEEHTILVKANAARLIAYQQQYNYKVNYFFGNIASVTCKLSSIASLIQNKIISYAEFVTHNSKTMNDTMVVKNRIKPVKQGQAPLTQAYDGTGVVVGIIDSGIDFNHPDFKDALGNTRIKFLWDQVPATNSTTPMPYNYGVEWAAAQINAGLCTHSDVAHYGHGTGVAGIAAGNGLSTGTHEGCAPKSDLVVVALDFNKNGPTIADAVNYIYSKATLLGKPCVINASVGDYYGSHDGTDMEAQLIYGMVHNVPGRLMVAAAGNAGGVKFHTKTMPLAGDTSFTWIKNNASILQYWCYGDTLQVQNLQFNVGVNRTNYSNINSSGFKAYNYGLSSIQTDTIKNSNNKRIGIVKTSASINTFGVYELYIKIIADTIGLLWRIETKGSGIHHAWNFDFVSSGLPTTTQYPRITKYIKPDSAQTMVSSFQCLSDVVTVANYVNVNNYYDVNSVIQSWATNNPGENVNDLAPSSSIGPTRDNKIKPDISATGAGVFSTHPLSLLPNLITNYPFAVAQGSFHVQQGGTSAASPVVAGLGALYLQKYPNATSIQFRDAVINCAYSDIYTTGTLPNYRWGYGKLDGKAAMLCSIATAINTNYANEIISCYPNPFTDKTKLYFDTESPKTISVFSVDGKLVYIDKFYSASYELDSNKFLFDVKGLLFVKVQSGNCNSVFKLIRTH